MSHRPGCKGCATKCAGGLKTSCYPPLPSITLSTHSYVQLPPMQSSRPPKVGSIPTITALRLQLDYGDTKLARCVAFYDDVRIFRRRYFTQDGSPGLGFYHWKSPQHQTGLTEMVNDFLDKEGNGTRYWPDDDASPNHNKLRYSEHHIQYFYLPVVTRADI